MDSTTAQWIDDITTWLDGRTDRHEEASILNIFGKADANQLNLPRVIDFAALAGLAAQVKTALGSPHTCF
jgi:hypothetical protein